MASVRLEQRASRSKAYLDTEAR